MKVRSHWVPIARKRYPRSPGLRRAFLRGALAASSRIARESNPYRRTRPRRGWSNAWIRAWDEGWKAGRD